MKFVIKRLNQQYFVTKNKNQAKKLDFLFVSFCLLFLFKEKVKARLLKSLNEIQPTDIIKNR